VRILAAEARREADAMQQGRDLCGEFRSETPCDAPGSPPRACRAPSSADSARRTDPGRSSGSRRARRATLRLPSDARLRPARITAPLSLARGSSIVPCERRLPAARFPDEAEHLAPRDRERNAVDRLDRHRADA
jgi:hypothetical protein